MSSGVSGTVKVKKLVGRNDKTSYNFQICKDAFSRNNVEMIYVSSHVAKATGD